MIYAAMFALIMLSAVCDAAGDAIKDYRTHLGDSGDAQGRKGHPYKDFWHGAKHLNRAALIAIGLCVWPATAHTLAFIITLFGGFFIGGFVWAAVYDMGAFWYALDERVKISTGWRWLDKVLGFHY